MRVGILGAGWAGEVHARAYSQLEDVEIAGVFSRRREAARKLAEVYGVPAWTEPERLFEDETIDAIDVCTPTCSHAELAIAACKAGKHVLCETPFALRLAEADAMIAAARTAGKLIGVAQVMRFADSFVFLRDLVCSGDLGTPRLADAFRGGWWPNRSDAEFGPLPVEPGIHDFDFLAWMLGRPASVSARGIKGASGGIDTVAALLDHEDGVLARVHVGFLPAPGYPFTMAYRVVCENGLVEFRMQLVPAGPPPATLTVHRADGSVEEPQLANRDPYLAECRLFVDCVAGNGDPALIDAAAARNGLDVALAAQESLEHGGASVALSR
ncbi:MAG: Gfo/Idh/MocA family protein [Gaiellaceae bacterium]